MANVRQPRRGDVESLLGRKPARVPPDMLGGFGGARVLVTGAAGSIGSTLCIRLAQLGAVRVVAVDAAEAGLVDLDVTARQQHGLDTIVPTLCDVRSTGRIEEVLRNHRPAVVFHAAAYKQVPLLESAPVEAVATNVFGTKVVAEAASRARVERLVLFSSDKAVRPTAVLGRTKLVAEWVVAAASAVRNAAFTAIRLVNVMDSAGSILPLFRRQAAMGLPVTVTDPAATRYLMTIDEAVDLALFAAAAAEPASVFCLHPGARTRILDLARIVAAGRPIAVVGLRPGDRRHEELCWDVASVTATAAPGVFREPIRAIEPAVLARSLDALEREVVSTSDDGVRRELAELTGSASREAIPA